MHAKNQKNKLYKSGHNVKRKVSDQAACSLKLMVLFYFGGFINSCFLTPKHVNKKGTSLFQLENLCRVLSMLTAAFENLCIIVKATSWVNVLLMLLVHVYCALSFI